MITAEERPLRIMVVEDDATDFFIICEYIKGIPNHSFIIDQCIKYSEALELIAERRYDLYFIDYRLGARTGLDLLRSALLQGCEEPLILLTGKGNTLIDQEAMEIGAADYLLKSEISSENLERSIRYALSRASVLNALRASEKKYRAVFEHSREAIFIADAKLRLRDLNESACLLFETPYDNLLQRSLLDFITDENVRAKISQSLHEAGEVNDLEVMVVDANGSIKNCLLSLTSHTTSSEAVNIHGIIHNITSLKKTEKAILQAEKLASTWRLASTLAHEVRNPLSTIQMSVEQIDEDSIKEEDKPLLEIISRNSQRINTLITHLLESSRPDEIQLEAIDVRRILEDSVQTAKDRAGLKGIQMVIQLPPAACLVAADAERLKIAFLNILVNAIEAVEPGSGRINVTLEKTDQHFIIDFADNGHGITKEIMANLFEPYFTSKKNGIGLGLSATLNIIKAHSGDIDVSSEPARETRFRIILPGITVDTPISSSENSAAYRKY